MVKIQRKENGVVVFAVSGRLEADSVGELSALLASEVPGRTLILELQDLFLADRDAVGFLRACEANGIVLRNCPAYIRIWMANEEDQV